MEQDELKQNPQIASINIEHLKLIQGVINRITNTSSIYKGWAITVVVAIIGFTVKSTNPYYLLLAIFAIAMFWLLDGYYLWIEKLFRKLYDSVRADTEDNQVESFSMNVEKYKKEIRYRKILIRPVLSGYYLPMIVLSLAIFIIQVV